MWQINKSDKSKTQFSCRIPNENLDDINALANRFQEEQSYPFSNGFDFLAELVSRFHKLEIENKELVSQLKTSVSSKNEGSIKHENNLDTSENTSENNLDTSENKSENNPDTSENTSENNLDTSENKSENNPDTSSIIDEIKAVIYEGIPQEEIPSGEAFYADILEVVKLTDQEPTEKIIEKEIEVERKLQPTEVLVNLSQKQLDLLRIIARWRYSKRKDETKLPVPNLIKRMVFNEGTLTNVHGEFETGIRTRRFKNFKKQNN